MKSSGGDGPDGGTSDGGTPDERDPPSDRDRADSGPDEADAAPARGSTDAWSRGPADADASPGPEEGPGGPFASWGALYTTVVVWMAGLILLLWLFTVTLRVEIGG